MFGIKTDRGYKEILKGIKIKTLVYGENSLMTEFILAEGAILPEHNHVHEQIGYLVKGKIKLIVDAKERLISPGESWCIPSNIIHKAEIIEDSIAIEVFTPRRDEYIQYARTDDLI